MKLQKTNYQDRNGETIYVGDTIVFEQIGSNAKIISKVIDTETARRLERMRGVRFTEDLSYIDNRSKIIKRVGGKARHSSQA